MFMRRAVCQLALGALVTVLAACRADRPTPLEPVEPGRIATRHQCRVDPEAVQQAARTTGPLSVLNNLCIPEDACPSCDGVYAFAWDDVSCFWGISIWDPDGDSVDNGCENAIARALAPELITARDCNYDHALQRQGGEYYFAAQRVADGDGLPLLRIAYLPAYYLDCGTPRDQLSACFDFLGANFCNGHTGDSELIIIDARFDASSQHWVTQRVFLSAHCGQITGGNCGWRSPSQFQWVDGRRFGAPVVWVAEGKHANYPSGGTCNNGAFTMDECRYNNASHRIPIAYGQQNIGSRAHPLRDCVGPFWNSTMTVPGAVECLWSRRTRPTFDGWQGYTRNDGSPVYERHLATYAGF